MKDTPGILDMEKGAFTEQFHAEVKNLMSVYLSGIIAGDPKALDKLKEGMRVVRGAYWACLAARPPVRSTPCATKSREF